MLGARPGYGNLPAAEECCCRVPMPPSRSSGPDPRGDAMASTLIGPYAELAPVCQPHDPRTAVVAQRVAEMITARLPAVSVEHIGSTAVPGCAGKGVVDLLLVYP